MTAVLLLGAAALLVVHALRRRGAAAPRSRDEPAIAPVPRGRERVAVPWTGVPGAGRGRERVALSAYSGFQDVRARFPQRLRRAAVVFRRSRLVSRARVAAGRRRRQRLLEAAVPEALDVLRATVAAGAAPGQGLAAAAGSVVGPLAPVLAGALQAHRLGVPAGRALAEAGAGAGVIELVTAGEALELATSTGAPIGQVLAGVARAAADRVRARQARLAATAEARLSARVLAGLGPAFLLLQALVAPDEVSFLVSGRSGWLTLALATLFEAAGLAWSSRILSRAT